MAGVQVEWYDLGFAALGLLALVAWYRTPKTWARETGCGRCGYSVRGASHFQCPECGSDLREAGISVVSESGAEHRRIYLTWAIGLLAISLSGVAVKALVPMFF